MNYENAFQRLKDRDAAAIFPTYGRYPLAVAHARGSRLYDLDGRQYIDLLSGIAVTALGHSHPEVVAAIAAQAQKLIHASNLFFQEEAVLLAEKLKATCRADKVFFCNSGAEANEAAFKLARRAMRTVFGRDAWEFVTLEGSFHGRTLAAVAATGQPKFKEHFQPMPEGFRHAPWGNLDALEAAITPTTAGVLVEMVQGEGGVRPMSQAYAQGVAELCRRKGVLFMVDEVQTGLCRSGAFWAHQRYGLAPDIFTTSKALAGGLPMGAMLASGEVSKGFAPGAHATTFGGGGLTAATARTVIDIMQRDALDRRAHDLGEFTMAQLRDLQARKPGKITEVRGLGLMIGVELAFPGKDVWQALLDRGFVCNLTQDRVLRLLPALTIPREDLAAFVTALSEVLDQTQVANG